MTTTNTDTSYSPKKSTRKYHIKANSSLRLSGEESEYSNLEDGHTTKFTNLKPIFSFSGERRELTHRQAFHHQISFLLLILIGDVSTSDLHTYI